MHQIQGPQEHFPEVRKHRRFDLQFPVLLSFPAGEVMRELEGLSKNVSLGGMLVKTRETLPLRSRVSFKLELAGPRFRRQVSLSADGEVVRVDTLRAGYAIAVKCNTPMTELQDSLLSSRSS